MLWSHYIPYDGCTPPKPMTFCSVMTMDACQMVPLSISYIFYTSIGCFSLSILLFILIFTKFAPRVWCPLSVFVSLSLSLCGGLSLVISEVFWSNASSICRACCWSLARLLLSPFPMVGYQEEESKILHWFLFVSFPLSISLWFLISVSSLCSSSSSKWRR